MSTGSDWLDQARRLLDTVVQGQTPAAGAQSSGTGAAHGSDCTRCPLCQAAAVLRGERPEVTAALADVLTATATALRALAEPARSGRPGTPAQPATPAEPGTPAAPGTSAAPGSPADAGSAAASDASPVADVSPEVGSPPAVQRIEIA
jgi:hypothetical protein